MDAETLTEFAVYLADRPGELAGVLAAASTAGVRIRSVSVPGQNGRGLIRLIGEPSSGLSDVLEHLEESGVGPVTESPVLAVSLAGRPNAVRDVAERFATEGINILHVYMIPAEGDEGPVEHPARCVFRVEDKDFDRAMSAVDGLA